MVEIPRADLVTTVLQRCQAVLIVTRYLFSANGAKYMKELFRKDVIFSKIRLIVEKRLSVMKFLRHYFYCGGGGGTGGSQSPASHTFLSLGLPTPALYCVSPVIM